MTDTSLLEMSEAFIRQPWLGAAPASVVLQIVALVRLKGLLRSLSLILGVITGAVLGLAVAASLLDPGTLWQLFIRLATPPILVLTTGLLLMGLVVRPRPQPPPHDTPHLQHNSWRSPRTAASLTPLVGETRIGRVVVAPRIRRFGALETSTRRDHP